MFVRRKSSVFLMLSLIGILIGLSPTLYASDWAVTQRVGLQFGVDMATNSIVDEKGESGFYHHGWPPRLSGNLFYDIGIYNEDLYLPTLLSIGLNANMSLFAKATAIDNNQDVSLQWHEWSGDVMLKIHLFAFFHLGVGFGVVQQHVVVLPAVSSGFEPRRSAHLAITVQSGFMIPLGDIGEDRWVSPLALLVTLRGAFHPTVTDDVIASKVKISLLVGFGWSFGEW